MLFGSCQSDETAIQNDAEAKLTINKASAILPTGAQIPNEDFALLKAIYEKYPNSETAFQTYKSALIVREDWATVEKILKSVPFSNLSDEDKANLGITYYKLGRYLDAIQTLKNINNENIADSQYILTAAYFNLGKYDEAKSLIENNWEPILKEKRGDQIAFLGLIYFYEKNYEKAIETLKKSLEIQPDNIQAANGLSRVYAAKGEPDKAEEYLAKIQQAFNKQVAQERQQTKLVEKLYEIKKSYEENRFQDVINLAEPIISQTNPQNRATLYKYLFNSYMALGMKEKAQETMTKAKQVQQR